MQGPQRREKRQQQQQGQQDQEPLVQAAEFAGVVMFQIFKNLLFLDLLDFGFFLFFHQPLVDQIEQVLVDLVLGEQAQLNHVLDRVFAVDVLEQVDFGLGQVKGVAVLGLQVIVVFGNQRNLLVAQENRLENDVLVGNDFFDQRPFIEHLHPFHDQVVHGDGGEQPQLLVDIVQHLEIVFAFFPVEQRQHDLGGLDLEHLGDDLLVDQSHADQDFADLLIGPLLNGQSPLQHFLTDDLLLDEDVADAHFQLLGKGVDADDEAVLEYKGDEAFLAVEGQDAGFLLQRDQLQDIRNLEFPQCSFKSHRGSPSANRW